MRFHDRTQAGVMLRDRLLETLKLKEPVVCALPRGGVVVAAPIAQALRTPIVPLGVRKIGAPGHEEFAIGALAEEGEIFMDNRAIKTHGFSWNDIEAVIDNERAEMKRRLKTYRGDEPLPSLKGKSVLVIDDGLATGTTMQVCCQMLRKKQPALLLVAVPVASREAVENLKDVADDVVALHIPKDFHAVGEFYSFFPQVDDKEVLHYLEK
jgi:putative phosphoribosyl transferase